MHLRMRFRAACRAFRQAPQAKSSGGFGVYSVTYKGVGASASVCADDALDWAVRPRNARVKITRSVHYPPS